MTVDEGFNDLSSLSDSGPPEPKPGPAFLKKDYWSQTFEGIYVVSAWFSIPKTQRSRRGCDILCESSTMFISVPEYRGGRFVTS